ncbi:extracellular solute-binding protein [Paenibacillus humicola]|uniref:extracellular solute-binding protein n=1 Tax=Paenibacillus humicola TaxID=3110540 RepID=UPI00237A8AC4|nr:extracellular solute-binding protein [Paenibacillus humicola]
MIKRYRAKACIVMLLGLVIALIASGCSSGGSNGGPAGNTSGGSGADSGASSGNSGTQEQADSGPLPVQMIAGLYNEAPDMNNEFWAELQKRLNVKLDINWIPSGDFDTKLDLILSSGNLPEIVAYPNQTLSPSMISAIKNGAFWDLTPLLGDLSAYPNLKNNLPPNALKYLSMNGKIYGLPRTRSRIDEGLNIRKDWLDKLHIPVPTTLDEYRDALKKIVAADPSGQGTFGIIGNGTIVSDGDGTFEAAFGAYKPTYNDDGGLIWHQLTPQYTDMVNYFRGLYADGSMAKEFSTMKVAQAQQIESAGRSATYVRSIKWLYGFETTAKKAQPDAQIMVLPPLKGPGGYNVELSTAVNGGFFISKKVPEDKVKRILKYLDASASKEMTDFAYNGQEGVHYNMVNGNKVPTDLAKQINTTSLGASVLALTEWGKVDDPAAPKEYNDEKHKEAADYEKVGVINPFLVLHSDTWSDIWPKYSDEWESMVTQAIAGKISMDDYKAYVAKLNDMSDFKKAYKEFADAYTYIK